MRSEFPVPSVAEPPAIPPAWNPVAIGWMSALLSFLPAGILWSLNWGRLGQPEKVRSRILWVVGLFAIYLPVAMAVPDRARTGLMVVNYAVAAYFHGSQKGLFAEHLARGGTRARFGKPLLYTVLGVVTFLCGVAAWVLPGSIRAGEAIDEGNRLLQAHDDQGALAAFQRAKDEDDQEPAAYWNLAVTYRRMHRYEEARRELEELRALDATFQGADGSTIDDQRGEIWTDEDFEQGRRALDGGDGPTALATFTRLAAFLPEDPGLHWNLALAHRLVGHRDEALRELDEVRRLDPEGRVIETANVERERAALSAAPSH